MKLETKVVTPWRKVSKPISKPLRVNSRLTVKPPTPPKVSQKPGSKVYLYVYDSEPESPGNAPQYYPNPHFARQVSGESEVPYPYAKEKEAGPPPAAPQTRKRSGKQRVRDQGRKSEKGYKVLAEVTPKLRSSSRGGKMFIKQKHRMEKFTKESPDYVPEEDNQYGRHAGKIMGATDGWATPWNMATKSPTAVKYITAKRLPGPINRIGYKDPLGFLPKPPDFWRAKVEQDFPSNGPKHPLIRPRSSQWHYRGQGTTTPMEVNGHQFRRPDSAPPLESPLYDEEEYEYPSHPMNNIYDDSLNNGYYSEYDTPIRPGSVALPSATIHFNAKKYYSAPHRRQGIRRGIQAITTTPYVQRDFNARAKGWHRRY